MKIEVEASTSGATVSVTDAAIVQPESTDDDNMGPSDEVGQEAIGIEALLGLSTWERGVYDLPWQWSAGFRG